MGGHLTVGGYGEVYKLGGAVVGQLVVALGVGLHAGEPVAHHHPAHGASFLVGDGSGKLQCVILGCGLHGAEHGERHGGQSRQ